jgi:hypothetical protein
MLLEVDGMGAVMEAAGAVADIIGPPVTGALALGSIIVGRMLGMGVDGIAMLVIAGVVTAELGMGALEVTGGVVDALGAIVAAAACVVVAVAVVNGSMSEATGSEQPPRTTEPSTVTKRVGDMETRDSNIALNVFFTGITPRQEFGAPSKAGWSAPAAAQGQLSVRPYWAFDPE